MPNAILRAGPFATSTDSFLNSGIPVNCANDTSSSAWPWRYVVSTSESVTNHIGWEVDPDGNDAPTFDSNSNTTQQLKTVTESFSATESFSESLSLNTNVEAQVGIVFNFAYQSVEDFDITVNYNGSVSSGGDSLISASGAFTSDTGSLSLSQTLTLPRAVKPNFVRLNIQSSGFNYPIDDIDKVFPKNKIISATMSVTLPN